MGPLACPFIIRSGSPLKNFRSAIAVLGILLLLGLSTLRTEMKLKSGSRFPPTSNKKTRKQTFLHNARTKVVFAYLASCGIIINSHRQGEQLAARSCFVAYRSLTVSPCSLDPPTRLHIYWRILATSNSTQSSCFFSSVQRKGIIASRLR